MVLQSCEREDPALSPKIAQLVGTWRLLEPASMYDVTLVFALDSANPPNDVTPFKANGKSAVNTYNAFLSAALDGLMIVTNLGSTKIGGSPEATRFEQTYFENLQAVVRYELTNTNRLRLFYGGAKSGVLVYERVN